MKRSALMIGVLVAMLLALPAMSQPRYGYGPGYGDAYDDGTWMGRGMGPGYGMGRGGWGDYGPGMMRGW
jgi:hypothetical protein